MTENLVILGGVLAIIVDKEEKRAEILKAALRAFAKKGAAGTKIQDIADEAGVAKGTIYLYFKNKAEILQHMLLQKVTSGEEFAEMALEASGDPREKLLQFFMMLASDIENQDYPPEIQLEILTTLLRSPGKKDLKREVLQLREVISKLVQRMQGAGDSRHDPGILAGGLLSLVHGAMILWIIDEKAFPIQEITRKTMDVLLDALEKDKG